MLFRVTRGDRSILLFGGSRPTPRPWSSPAIEALAAAADEFWCEVPPMNDGVQALAVRYGIDQARPLALWLSTEERALVERAANSVGVNAQMLAALRPWLAAQVLRIAADAHIGLNHEQSAEGVLRRRASEGGATLKSEFATPEDVFASFASMSGRAEVQYLHFTLYEIDGGLDRVVTYDEGLAAGDLSPIERETQMMKKQWPDLYGHLVVPRNEAWLPRFNAMLDSGTNAFVVVGSGHLVGDDGLLSLLPASGFAVAAERH